VHTLVRACDRLATGIDFVRMDLYLTSSSPSGMAFGEATFTPRAGHNLFDPPSIDAGLGRRWCDGMAETWRALSWRVLKRMEGSAWVLGEDPSED
jgi:hypothetical protein